METETLATSEATITFENLELAPFLKKTISTVGYSNPTPIQAQAIPLLLEGSDLIGLAQTGTGKTAAFVLPLLHKLSLSESSRATKALILAPTRELAEQINDVIVTFAPRTGIKSTTVYGGVSHHNQVRSLRSRPEIVVACPGRLLDHIRGKTIDLSTIEFFILDEADRMLDMGFLPDIKKIISEIPEERQTMLFSATMPSEIEALTKQVLKEPVVVRVKSERPVALVTHSMYSVKDTEKPGMLASWLSGNPEALVVVFTKMKHTAKRLAEKLDRSGVAATSLHGNLSQGKRQHALNGFRDGKYRVMIATDIAARGIDVDGVTHVLNYDMPDTLDAYIHRSGRAGRAERTGDAVSFVTRADGWILKQVEKWVGKPLNRLQGAPATLDGGAAQGSEVAASEEESYDDSPPQRHSRGRGGRSSGDRAPRGRSSRGGDGQRSRDGRSRGSRFGSRRDDNERRGGSQRGRPGATRSGGGDRPRFNQEGDAGEPQTAFMGSRSYQTGGAREEGSSDRRRGPRNDRSPRRFDDRREGRQSGRFEQRERPFGRRGAGSGRSSWGRDRSEGRGERLPWAQDGERPARSSSFRGQQDIADTSGALRSGPKGSSRGGDRGFAGDRRRGPGAEKGESRRRFGGSSERSGARPSGRGGFKGQRDRGQRREGAGERGGFRTRAPRRARFGGDE
jgi:ATP-dependent RNA helicase RhlE